ncbi:unnamed protein product [Pylaiella littoralis]
MASTDRDALVALYNATDGANWNQKANWNTDADLSLWQGIAVNVQGRVVQLHLSGNNLRGLMPKELGGLSKLQILWLGGNQLTGTIPRELGELTALMELHLNDNGLTDGPDNNESLSAWRSRLQAELVEKKPAEQERTEQSRAEEHARLQPMFRVQVASFAELDELTRENLETLQEIKQLLEKPAAGIVPSGTELTDADKLQELDKLVTMAKTLGDVASRHIEDEDIQRKEMTLGPVPKAYYAAIRSGLCNAYFAASVVGSGLVSTSKVGVMGKAGTAFKLISGAVPMVGWIASFAGAALKAGDCLIQTRRVVKITDLAPDAVECSKLAKSLALRLTDGLTDDTIATSCAKTKNTHNAAGVGWGAGEGDGSGALADGVSEEDFMEWFVEEFASCESSNCGAAAEIREVQAGRRLGKQHLHKLLTAVGQDCLQGTNNTWEKVNRLVLVILAGADFRPAETSNASEGIFVRSRVSAPSHDGVVQQLAAELEALKAAMKSVEDKHHAELGALKSDKEKHHAEVEALKGKVATFEKRLPKSHGGLGGLVDAGGGYILAQEQKTESQEEFNERMEYPARAADWQTVTPGGLRVTQAHVEEVGRETGHLGARIAALEENRGELKELSPAVAFLGLLTPPVLSL